MKYLILMLLALSTALGFLGCMNTNPDDQTVPWGRPADWESGSPFQAR